RAGGTHCGALCCVAPRWKNFSAQFIASRVLAIFCHCAAMVSGSAASCPGVFPRLLSSAQSGALWHQSLPAFTAILVLHPGFSAGYVAVDGLCAACTRGGRPLGDQATARSS